MEPQERAGNGLPEGRVATRGLELLRRAEQARSAVRAAVEAFVEVLLVLQIDGALGGGVRMGSSKDAQRIHLIVRLATHLLAASAGHEIDLHDGVIAVGKGPLGGLRDLHGAAHLQLCLNLVFDLFCHSFFLYT